jgi:hypothetical protein
MQGDHGESDKILRLKADPYTEIDLLIEDLRKFSDK